MPREIERGGIVWARPWLEQPRTAIEAYVRRHRLRFVDDPSNDDARFARSRLRRTLWPALVAAFPDAEATLAAAARHAQETQAALGELSAADLAASRDDQALHIEAWQALSSARRVVVLRAWLRERGGQGAPETLVRRLLDELPGRGAARWPLGPGCDLRRYRGRLEVTPSQAAEAPLNAMALRIAQPGTYEIASWQGALRVTAVRSGGVALQRMHRCELRARTGSERFQAALDRPPRSLKKQFQAASIPPWQRGAPLLYCDGRLVFVPGLGIDAAAIAEPDEPQVALEWVPASPSLLHRNR
jgi:tRNA(Ile)-lysidine synthase